MKAFVCPQCGASLEYERLAGATVRCHYCNSVVIVPAELRPEPPPRTGPAAGREAVRTFDPARPRPKTGSVTIALSVAGAILVVCLVLTFTNLRTSRKDFPRGLVAPPTPAAAQTPRPTPDPAGYTVAYTFGGEGTGNGYFKDEMEVATDGAGNLYVSDETLRVQKFDAAGGHQATWAIPAETKWYKRLRREWPRKLLANTSGDVYAVLAGVVVKFDGATGEVLGALHGSDRIHDATLIPNGGLLVVSQKGADDELVLIGGDGRAARRTHRFVSSVLDKRLTVEALRVGADGSGTTYALYALGDVYGEHWYDDEDLAVFKFTPEGKYAARFGGGGSEPGHFGVPSAIAVDNQSRVYVCEPFDKIHVYAGDGRYLRTLKAPHMVKSLTFDAQNNLLIAGGHKVSKLTLEAGGKPVAPV
jgi:DNA-directed RNA polymerase subunit RPC12/RpoP